MSAYVKSVCVCTFDCSLYQLRQINVPKFGHGWLVLLSFLGEK